MMDAPEQTLITYDSWLERQLLVAKTCVAHSIQAHQYTTGLAQCSATTNGPLITFFASGNAVWDNKSYLKIERQAKPTSVNLTLAAINHFYQFIGKDRPRVQHESLPAQTPCTLKSKEQKALLRTIEQTSSKRNKTIADLRSYMGIYLRECVTLNLDDIPCKRVVIIRSGKSDTYHKVPLNTEVCKVLGIWLKVEQPILADLQSEILSQPQRETALCRYD